MSDISKCNFCGRKFTKAFNLSSYWENKNFCPDCREIFDEEAKHIDKEWELEKEKAKEALKEK